MLAVTNAAVKKLRKLGKKLERECTRDKPIRIGGFTIMFNNEDGRTIYYVKQMPIEQTGSMQQFYDRASSYYLPEYRTIKWPYTGFVQGNRAGWMPIAIPTLGEWLERWGYPVDDFVKTFRSRRA